MSKPTKQMHLLYAEDDLETAQMVVGILKRFFGVVSHFENGQKAFDYYKERPNEIDLVVTDVTMPVMDGIKLIEKIKELSPATKPIIVVTAHNVEYEEKLSKLDVIVMNKPLEFDAFLQTINNLVIE